MIIFYVAADISIPGIMGGSTHTLEVARNLVRLGHEVIVLCRRDIGQKSYELYHGIHLHRIYRGITFPTKRTRWKETKEFDLKRRLYHMYLHTTFFIYAGFVATRITKTCDVDIILERGTSFGEGALASIFTNRPLVLEVISPHYSPISFQRAKKILTFSKEALEKVPKKKVEVVTAAVNVDLFDPKTDGSHVRTHYGLKNSFVIGYVGSFAQWHGVDILIHAMKDIVAYKPKSKLMLIGPFPQEASHIVKELKLEKHVIFTGSVRYDFVPSYLAACDVLVAPYTSRQWSKLYSYIKIYEYMAMGKPLVTTNIIPDAKIVHKRNLGILVKPDDPLELSQAILRISSDKNLALRLAQNARQVAIEHSWFAYTKRLVDLLKSVLQISN